MTAPIAADLAPYEALPLCAQELRAADGVQLHVETIGQGPSMLMCNGLFCSMHYYGDWTRHFSKRYQLVRWDYRGHGQSQDPKDLSTMTITQLSLDAQQVLEQMCPGPTVLVGHSMGVRVALELYARRPERIRGLILLCGSAYDSLGLLASRLPIRSTILGSLHLGQRIAATAEWIKKGVVQTELVHEVAYLMGGMSRSLTPREPVQGLLKNVGRMDVRAMAVLARSYIRHSSKALLPSVQVPTLFLVGEKDALAPPFHARRVARRLPQGEAYIVNDCTHLALIERPDEVHQAVEAFLHRHQLEP